MQEHCMLFDASDAAGNERFEYMKVYNTRKNRTQQQRKYRSGVYVCVACVAQTASVVYVPCVACVSLDGKVRKYR